MNTCMCVVGVCAHSCVCLVPGGHHLLELELYMDGCKLSYGCRELNCVLCFLLISGPTFPAPINFILYTGSEQYVVKLSPLDRI